MKHQILVGSLILTLAACGGGSNPVTGGGTGGGGGGGGLVNNTIPAELAGNLNRIAYDPAAGTLTVEIKSLDTSPVLATYQRNAALDVPGYTAFSVQEDPLDRMFIALVAASPDGAVQAGAVADGGQFNSVFRGGYYSRSSTAALPTTGQVSYAGTYAGITNLDPTAGPSHLLPVPPGTDPSLVPHEGARTSGDIFLNVNFDDAAVNGAIYNRKFVASSDGLATVILTPSTLDSNGEFLGTVEFDNDPTSNIGSYGGIIGGPDGNDMAGVVYLSNIFLPTDSRDGPFDSEVGVFVLPRCGTPGAPPICSSVNP